LRADKCTRCGTVPTNNMKRLTSPILLLLVFTAFASVAVAQRAYTDGKAAGLTSEQIAELKGLNAAVGVPTYIPAGFKLDAVVIEEPPAPEIVGYTLTYSNAKGRSFTIQSVNDGIGDVSSPQVYGRNSYFDGRIQAGYSMDEEKSLFVSWVGSLERYQPKNTLQQWYSLVADRGDITLREAVKVMASLRYLKR